MELKTFKEFIKESMFYTDVKDKFNLKTNFKQSKYIGAVNPSNMSKMPASINPAAGMNRYNPRKLGPSSITRKMDNVYTPPTPSKGFDPVVSKVNSKNIFKI